MNTITVADLRVCWTMWHAGSRLACAVIAKPSGGYTLRLTCNGQRLLDRHFTRLDHAVERSDDAFEALSSRGWLPEGVDN